MANGENVAGQRSSHETSSVLKEGSSGNPMMSDGGIQGYSLGRAWVRS